MISIMPLSVRDISPAVVTGQQQAAQSRAGFLQGLQALGQGFSDLGRGVGTYNVVRRIGNEEDAARAVGLPLRLSDGLARGAEALGVNTGYLPLSVTDKMDYEHRQRMEIEGAKAVQDDIDQARQFYDKATDNERTEQGRINSLNANLDALKTKLGTNYASDPVYAEMQKDLEDSRSRLARYRDMRIKSQEYLNNLANKGKKPSSFIFSDSTLQTYSGVSPTDSTTVAREPITAETKKEFLDSVYNSKSMTANDLQVAWNAKYPDRPLTVDELKILKQDHQERLDAETSDEGRVEADRQRSHNRAMDDMERQTKRIELDATKGGNTYISSKLEPIVNSTEKFGISQIATISALAKSRPNLQTAHLKIMGNDVIGLLDLITSGKITEAQMQSDQFQTEARVIAEKMLAEVKSPNAGNTTNTQQTIDWRNL